MWYNLPLANCFGTPDGVGLYNCESYSVGAPIGRPFVKKTNIVGRDDLIPPIAECIRSNNGGTPFCCNKLNIQICPIVEIFDFQFVCDKSAAPGQAALQQLHIPRTDARWAPLRWNRPTSSDFSIERSGTSTSGLPTLLTPNSSLLTQ